MRMILEDLRTTPLADFTIFCFEIDQIFKEDSGTKKYIFKCSKIIKTGGMFRLLFLPTYRVHKTCLLLNPGKLLASGESWSLISIKFKVQRQITTFVNFCETCQLITKHFNTSINNTNLMTYTLITFHVQSAKKFKVQMTLQEPTLCPFMFKTFSELLKGINRMY